jgi:hypothetical protein
VTPSTAFASILSEWQTATGEVRAFSTNYVGTFTKKFSEGDNWFDILDEIGELCKCVWKVNASTIVFNEIIGTDKSLPASPDFFEFVFNGQDFAENNIDQVEVETYSTLSNYVIGK